MNSILGTGRYKGKVARLISRHPGERERMVGVRMKGEWERREEKKGEGKNGELIMR